MNEPADYEDRMREAEDEYYREAYRNRIRKPKSPTPSPTPMPTPYPDEDPDDNVPLMTLYMREKNKKKTATRKPKTRVKSVKSLEDCVAKCLSDHRSV